MIPTTPQGLDESRPWPAVVNPVLQPSELLARGIAVVRYRLDWGVLPRPEAAEPPEDQPTSKGKSVGVWLLASPSPDVIGRSYFHLIWSEGTAVKAVVEYLAALAFVDAERLGIAGISTNGFKALSALVAGVQFRAAVVVGSCADYHSFLADSPVALGGAELDLAPEYETWLREREAVRQVAAITDTALLMVNGGRDHIIPTSCVEGSVETIRRAYGRVDAGERFHLSWWPDATHNSLVDVASEEILAWWVKWFDLPPTAGADRALAVTTVFSSGRPAVSIGR